MTMGLPCDSDGYDLRMRQCPRCGSRGCPSLHRLIHCTCYHPELSSAGCYCLRCGNALKRETKE